MKKVCYIQHASEHLLILPIAKALKEKDMEFCFVCKSSDAKDFYLKNGFEVFNIVDDVFNTKVDISESEKEELDLKYGPPGIRELYDSDVHLEALFGKKHKAKEEIVVKAIKFWESFFDKNKIDFLINNETASFPNRSSYLVAKKRGIPMFHIASGPDNDHIAMNDVGETYVWQELLDLLNDENKLISEKEKEKVLNFINKRIQRVNKMPVYFTPESLFRSIKNLIGLWIRDNSKNRKEEPIWVGGLNYGRSRLWKRIKWSYFTRYFFKYDKNIDDKKYVYFPFFSAKETYYLSNDMYYGDNEISLIKEVARCLPMGYFLYTKEHPFNPGDFTYSQLKELKKSPNIKVFHPSISSQELIDNSSAIVTVEGTVGWEGFLCQKPVVCIGGVPYYAHSSLVYKVNNICNLSSVLWQAIRKGSKIYKDKNEEWFWFIYKVLSTCGFGSIYEPGRPRFMKTKENFQNLANSFFEKININLKK